MAKSSIVIHIKLAWWFRFYVSGVAIMATITGLECDRQKLGYWCAKAVTLTDPKGNKLKGLNKHSGTSK